MKLIKGSCNTCKYRVSIPYGENLKASCCFHNKMDCNHKVDCELYTYSEYYYSEYGQEDLKREVEN